MGLSPQQLRNVGTVAGIVIFAGPLVALYFSLSGWDADEALKAKREAERLKREESAPVRPRRAAPAPKARPAGEPAPIPTSVPSAGGDPTPAGPVVIALRRVSSYKVELAFTNVSEDSLWLAMPDGPGGLVRIAPVGVAPELPVVPLYDEERDDYMTRLLAGATHKIELKRQAGFPRGPIRALYDSRGDGVPEKAWRGTAESSPAP